MTVRRASPGQPLSIPAADYNAMADAADGFARGGFGTGQPSAGLGAGPHRVPVRVRNATGSAIPAYATVTAAYSLAAELTIADNEAEVARTPLVAVTNRSGSDARPFLVVVQQDIPADATETGVGVVHGVCVATVSLTNLAHRFADLGPSGQYLRSATTGPVRILQAATTGTGMQACLVDVIQAAGDGTGGGGVCPAEHYLQLADWKIQCTTFGENLMADQTYEIRATGCATDGLFVVLVSGTVTCGDEPVEGVSVEGNTQDVGTPNTDPPTYGEIAVTAADGAWSGEAVLEIDQSGPSPFMALRISAPGYTPNPVVIEYSGTGPVTGIDFECEE